jgi:hypothetical protein
MSAVNVTLFVLVRSVQVQQLGQVIWAALWARVAQGSRAWGADIQTAFPER